METYNLDRLKFLDHSSGGGVKADQPLLIANVLSSDESANKRGADGKIHGIVQKGAGRHVTRGKNTNRVSKSSPAAYSEPKD